jgi:hypothetical protein
VQNPFYSNENYFDMFKKLLVNAVLPAPASLDKGATKRGSKARARFTLSIWLSLLSYYLLAWQHYHPEWLE